MRLATDYITYELEEVPEKLPAPAPSPTVTKVEGYIIDENGNTLKSAFINLVYNDTGLPIDPAYPPFETTAGTYSAWTQLDPAMVAVLFAAKGYQDRKISFPDLIKAPDVIMKKSGGGNEIALIAIAALALSASNKNKSIGKIEFNMQTVLTGAAAYLILFKALPLINDILTFFGLSKDKDDKDVESTQNNPDTNPLGTGIFLKAPMSTQSQVTTALFNKVTGLGERLMDSFGAFNDNEAQAIGVFKTFTTQVQASYFANVWQNVWGYGDLIEWLKGDGYPNDRLDTGEINQILQYLKKLPRGY
jgi:hypothetical protein